MASEGERAIAWDEGDSEQKFSRIAPQSGTPRRRTRRHSAHNADVQGPLRTSSIKDLKFLSQADDVLNLKNILKAKRAGLHRSVRMAHFMDDNQVEKWIFSQESAERRSVNVSTLAQELQNDSFTASHVDTVAHFDDNMRSMETDAAAHELADAKMLSQHTSPMMISGHHTLSDFKDQRRKTDPAQGRPNSLSRVVWYHLYGSDDEALVVMAKHFAIRPQDVHAACTPAVHGPEVQFVRGATRDRDYLFLICHELRLTYGDGGQHNLYETESGEPVHSLQRALLHKDRYGSMTTKNLAQKLVNDKQSRDKKRDPIWAAARELELEEVQVCFFFFPDQQVLISVGLSSMQSPVLEAARNNIENVRSALRQDCKKGNGAVTLMVVMLDALMDTILPTLDLYGDVLEGIGLLINAQPDHTFVRLSTKLKTRLHQIIRYTWDARGVFLELQQDMHGVMNQTGRTQTLINSSTQIEKETQAYITMCTGIESFYHAFQQSQMNSTLYTLTAATISIMPMQLLTGIWGMNFDNMPELRWEYGYLMFWMLATFVLVCALLFIGRASVIARKGTLVLHRDPH